MRYLILMLLTLTVFMTACGNVDDTDGKIGNESNETTDGTENIKDKASDVMDDATDKASDMMDDMSDAFNDATGALSGRVLGLTRLTTEQAQFAALSDAGFSAKDVTFYKTYLHNEDGRVYYDVEFATAQTMYDYEIDSVSGNVLKREESVVK